MDESVDSAADSRQLQVITTPRTDVVKLEEGFYEFLQDETVTARTVCDGGFFVGRGELSFPEGLEAPEGRCAVWALGNLEILGPLRLGYGDIALWAGGETILWGTTS
jgi:hypothetical protein